MHFSESEQEEKTWSSKVLLARPSILIQETPSQLQTVDLNIYQLLQDNPNYLGSDYFQWAASALWFGSCQSVSAWSRTILEGFKCSSGEEKAFPASCALKSGHKALCLKTIVKHDSNEMPSGLRIEDSSSFAISFDEHSAIHL